MSSYLEIIVGQLSMLVDAACVHEIVELGAEGGEGLGHSPGFRHWRGQTLRRVSCRSMLGLQADREEERVGIVYADRSGKPPVFLEADGIAKLNQRKNFTALPLIRKCIDARLDQVQTNNESGLQLFYFKRSGNHEFTDYSNVAFDVSMRFDGVV